MDSRKIDWTKKGLGWIPDLPVIAEPERQSGLPPHDRNDGTAPIAQLTTQFIDLLDSLLENPSGSQSASSKTPTPQQKKIKAIRENLSSLNRLLRPLEAVSFPTVQFYKVLRKTQFNSEKEVIHLKQALLKLYLKFKVDDKPIQQFEDFIEEVEKQIEIDSNTFKFIKNEDQSEWLKTGLFDDDLEQLVKDLQTGMQDEDPDFVVDGIVGLKTITAIDQKLHPKADGTCTDRTVSNPEDKVVLLPIPPTIPEEILQIGFDYLRLAWLKERIKQRLGQHSSNDCQRIDDYFLTNSSDILAWLSKLQKQTDESEQEENKAKRSENIELQKLLMFLGLNNRDAIAQRLQADIKNPPSPLSWSYDDFSQLLCRHYHIIELFVAAVYLVASPFSGYTNPRDALRSSFQKIGTYLKPDFRQKSELYEPFAALFQAYSGQNVLSDYDDSKREQVWLSRLVTGALIKMHREERELKERCQKKSQPLAPLSSKASTDTDPEKIRSFFRFTREILAGLGKNMQDQFPLLGSQEVGREVLESSAYYSILYNKQELFAIPDLVSNQIQDSSQQICPPVPVQIPVQVERIKAYFAFEESQAYYFFLPNVVDLSLWCSPAKDQGSLNACTALSGIALLEYWARQQFGKHDDLSALFLYKVARELMQRPGDAGSSIQATMQAMVLFGVPPATCWPYQEERFDDIPPSFCYSYAQNYQTLQYFRLDSAEVSSDKQLLLFKIRATLAAALPCLFGLTLYSSAYTERNTRRGYIPYPSDQDTLVGGHTLVAVGYNDYKVLDRADGTPSTPGALLVRNSWGAEWGKEGYGWLPYDYILKGLTADWWSLVHAEWFDQRAIGLGVREPGGGDPEYPKSRP